MLMMFLLGNVFGAHASTSWINTEGGWIGNGKNKSITSSSDCYYNANVSLVLQLFGRFQKIMKRPPPNFIFALDPTKKLLLSIWQSRNVKC